MNCILLSLEFRGMEKHTFKSREGKEIEMEIYSFLDSRDNKVKLTLAPEELRSESNFDLSILKRGNLYDVECHADQMTLVSTNDMATTYQQRYKIVSLVEHYDAASETPFDGSGKGIDFEKKLKDKTDSSGKYSEQTDKTGGK